MRERSHQKGSLVAVVKISFNVAVSAAVLGVFPMNSFSLPP
jgi:hypothetical protein